LDTQRPTRISSRFEISKPRRATHLACDCARSCFAVYNAREETLIDTAKKSSKLRRIISAVVLALLVLVLFLMFHKPAPLAEPMAPAAVAANAQSFQQKLSALDPPSADPNAAAQTSTPEEVRFTGDELQAALVQSNAAGTATPQNLQTPSGEQINLQGAPVVSLEDDVVKGQFQAEVAGQKVYVTVAGHLGMKDGYATFEPTEFRIGDMKIPVSIVNAQLQKKMAEQRDRMKLPDFISDIAVEKGELVIKRK
jgi:type II secretory pathway component PulM